MIIRVSIFCLFIFGFCHNLPAQDKQTCKVTKNLGGKYKLQDKGRLRTVDGKEFFFLTIKLEPKKFNKDYLLKVAQRLRETYCNENRINALILDDSYYNKRFDDLDPPPILHPATKAIYGLDRVKGEEVIELVSNAGEILPKTTGKIIIRKPEN